MGSSPLTRGKPWAQIKAAVSVGLIPAHAGKTPPTESRTSPMEAHPRSRGENRQKTLSLSATLGSSPLTRGKQHGVMAHEEVPGLIPAHAGKTETQKMLEVWEAAHPRSRGENTPPVGALVCVTGSSPLTRGKPRARRRGQTRWEAHPRSRGENDGGFAWRAGFPGSSPLTRGKPSRSPHTRVRTGLIPAHAGKTLLR